MATTMDAMTGRRIHRQLLAGLAAAAVLAPVLTAAAERTANVQLIGRELKGAIVPMKDVSAWRVTNLGTRAPMNLPVDQIASIDAARISGTCKIEFGTVRLRNGKTVDISGNLRDIIDIPVQSIIFRIVDPTGADLGEDSVRCNGWRRMEFLPAADAKPES